MMTCYVNGIRFQIFILVDYSLFRELLQEVINYILHVCSKSVIMQTMSCIGFIQYRPQRAHGGPDALTVSNSVFFAVFVPSLCILFHSTKQSQFPLLMNPVNHCFPKDARCSLLSN